MKKVVASVKAIVQKRGKFLLLRMVVGNKSIWGLPGGKVEYGEELEEALKREVKEETCLDIKVGKIAGIYWFYSERKRNQVVCITYFCLPRSKDIDLSNNPAEDEEVVEYKWVTKEEFIQGKYTEHKSLEKFISQAL